MSGLDGLGLAGNIINPLLDYSDCAILIVLFVVKGIRETTNRYIFCKLQYKLVI
jgi:hypothetical protein